MVKITQLKDNNRTIKSTDFQIDFLKSGDIFRFTNGDFLINQVEGNLIDGSMNNIYLRILDGKKNVLDYHPLMGIKSNSHFSIGEKQASWKGSFKGIEYEVRFLLTDESIWFWEIELEGYEKNIDIIYGQDIGLATNAALKANEAYVSQYVDHKVFESENGFAIGSRQNQPQGSLHPFIQQGSLNKTVGFSTDGFQFFGTSFKETDEPEMLSNYTLPNKNYQYEFNYIALQSERMTLKGEEKVVFYGCFKNSYPTAVKGPEDINKIQKIYNGIKREEHLEKIRKVSRQSYIGNPLETIELTSEEIKKLYPKRIQEEYKAEKLLSFFTDSKEHIVLKEKEVKMERPHGQILFTHNKAAPDESIVSTTSWMYGIFNAQLVMGNTDMNKFLTNARNALNFFKTSGQRVYVEIDGEYRLLTMPSLMEIGINHVKWQYKTEKETFLIRNYTSSNSSTVQLSIKSKSGKHYRYLVTNQLAMNNMEYVFPAIVDENKGVLRFKFDKNTEAAKQFPDLTYYLSIKAATSKIVGEDFLLDGIQEGSTMLVNIKVDLTDKFDIQMQGALHGEEFEEKALDFQKEKSKFQHFFTELSNGFSLEANEEFTNFAEKMNVTIWWYTHNMLVHYLVPHGLEQFGGAAWGTRDVSQGPTEYFMSMQKFENVKEIIERVYRHQHTDGNWPQWFMFDSYSHLQADESHGDVIVWPLKLLADYLEATNDFSILEISIPYYDKKTKKITNFEETLINHVGKQLTYIQDNFLWDTFLSSYGDGDWDDTLQPHDQSLKKNMASSWTIALTYQTLNTFGRVLQTGGIKWSKSINDLSKKIKSDYEHYISSDDSVPGFIHMPTESSIEKMIHPYDNKTGIHYRLLPMTRSMISELFTKEQANIHYQIIQDHLKGPDGVRLMNRPATYSGGVSHRFKRAEQAANFGREIGLMYVHAHIRFIEAMAKIGKAEEIWDGFEIINPININQKVENAKSRQSNAYFSSSDADFSDRYEAQENFGLVKQGKIPVKGGWRIYSSGPGIYVNQLVTNALGIRIKAGDLIIDPVLLKEMNGFILHYVYGNYPLQINYHYVKNKVDHILINGKKLQGKRLENPYRFGALCIEKESLHKKLNQTNNILDVYYHTNQ